MIRYWWRGHQECCRTRATTYPVATQRFSLMWNGSKAYAHIPDATYISRYANNISLKNTSQLSQSRPDHELHGSRIFKILKNDFTSLNWLLPRVLSIYTDGSGNSSLYGPFPWGGTNRYYSASDNDRNSNCAYWTKNLYRNSTKCAYTAGISGTTAGPQGCRWELPGAPAVYSTYTDSESAKSTLEEVRRFRNSSLQEPRCPFRVLPQLKGTLQEVHHVKAHAERRQQFPAFTDTEYGNFIADAVADGRQDVLLLQCATLI